MSGLALGKVTGRMNEPNCPSQVYAGTSHPAGTLASQLAPRPGGDLPKERVARVGLWVAFGNPSSPLPEGCRRDMIVLKRRATNASVGKAFS